MSALFAPPIELAELHDEYELLGELGRGGSAVVYHARDRTLGRAVAIKVVHPRPTSPDDDPVTRLAREARTVAQLQHANIVAVYAVRKLRSGGLALIMQLVPGATLKLVVQRDGPLAPEQTEGILRDVAAALSCAHARGLVHRDVKPENIFLDEGTGRALLADFGIARSTEADSMTMTGTAVGTPFYMSPEQVDGGTVDGRSDLYSLGLVAWESLTGRRPWDGESLYSVIYKQKLEELPPIEALRPGVPLRLQYLVERMLQKRPGARWAGADGLLAQLDHSVLPADYARWQRALPSRVERYHELRERRAVKHPVTTTATHAEPLASSSTVHFARDTADAPSGPALAAPDFGDPTGVTHPSPWVPGPVPPNDERGTAPTYGDTVEPIWAVPADPNSDPTSTPRSKAWRRGVALTLGVIALAVAGGAVAYGRLAGDRLVGDIGPNPIGSGAVTSPSTFRHTSTGTAAAGTAALGPKNPSTLAHPRPSSTVTPEILSAGGRHTCVLTLAGRTYCWGADERGQLGDGGTIASQRAPVAVAGVLSFEAVAGGLTHSCALTRLGDVYCWGANPRGQLGDATTVQRNAPVRVAGPATFVAVAAGAAHSCGVTTDNTVDCWGANDQGQLGDGTRTTHTVPTAVRISGAVTQVAAGGQHTCALIDTGRVFCWGSNNSGQLGSGVVTGPRLTPRLVPVPGRVTAVRTGLAHTCALTADGALWCWGRNDSGQLGDSTRRSRPAPTQVHVARDHAFVGVVSGAAHTCALDASGGLWCWGRNNRGAIGDGSTVDRTSPRLVQLTAPVVAATAGTAHTCATTFVRVTLCWGDNLDGQLGDGKAVPHSVPGAVHYPAGVTPRARSAMMADAH